MTTQAQLLTHGFASSVVSPIGGQYVNRNIAIKRDLIFGLSVWNGDEWFPLVDATYAELTHVQQLIYGDPLFQWYDELAKIVKDAIARESV